MKRVFYREFSNRRRQGVRTHFTGMVVIALLILASAVWANEPLGRVHEGAAYAPGRLLIKLTASAVNNAAFRAPSARDSRVETGLTSLDALHRSVNAQKMYRAHIEVKNKALDAEIGVSRWYMLEVPQDANIPAIVARYHSDGNVEAATPDWQAFPAAIPNDPIYSSQWGHNNTGQMLDYCWSCGGHPNGSPVGTPGFDSDAQIAWDGSQGYGSASIIIGIIDSGVDIDHPDLRLVAGYDYGDNDSNPDDNSASAGHGTACAGVAAARANNSLGVAGIAGGCSVMPLKVANSAGSMYFSSIQNALYHAADNGAHIASMSLGAAISSDPATDNAILYAYNAGVTILAATGNENKSVISYPAINAYVIGVGAASPCGDRKRSSSNSGEVNPGVSTDPNGYTCDGERWWGSSYGTNSPDAAGAVDIIAPTIMPTTDIGGSAGYDPSDYSMWFNGTSCATPYAAGVAALIKSKNPSWTPAQVRAQLVSTASDVQNVESGAGWDRYSGYGMVNAGAAVGGGGSNTPPVANANGPYSGTVGVAVSFSSAGSYDPDGSISSYLWNFGDGSTSTAANPTHVYATANTYNVSLTVTDNNGAQDTDNTTASITAGGGNYASLPYSTGFEGGSLDQYWASSSSNSFGRIQVTGANTPHGGSYHLTMDSNTNGNYVTNEATLHLNLSGYTQVNLDFWWKEFGDETHTQDGVYFSDDGGGSYVKVQDLNGQSYSNNSWNQFSLDVDALASANGLSLSSTFVVKFQQYDNYAITTDGFAFDDISVSGSSGNTPPVANANGPYSGTTGVAVSFSSAGSSDPDGSISSYLWNFGDGGTSTAANPTHTYAAAGTYNVSLTVTDNGGAQDTDNTTAEITDPPVGNYATLPYSTGFESGGFDQYWESFSTSDGRVRFLTSNGPHSGSYHMTMDDPSSGGYSQNEAWLRLNLAGESQVTLSFWWKEFGDETHTQDGVYFSDDDGASFVKVQALNGQSYSNNTWQQFTLDLDALASANSLSLSSTFVVKFQQYDNYPISTDGFAFDDIAVTGGGGGPSYITAESEPNGTSASADGPVGSGVNVNGTISSSSDDDWYYFDVTSPGNINISVAIGSSADLDWFLYHESNLSSWVARGYTVNNPEAGSYNATATGRYYLWVDGYNGATSGYTLSISGGLAKFANSGPEKSDLTIPEVFSLEQNYPNPFNPTTSIQVAVPEKALVTLEIFDITGRKIQTLLNDEQEPGVYTVSWDGTNQFGEKVSSGIYFYRMAAGKFIQTRRMMLLK